MSHDNDDQADKNLPDQRPVFDVMPLSDSAVLRVPIRDQDDALDFLSAFVEEDTIVVVQQAVQLCPTGPMFAGLPSRRASDSALAVSVITEITCSCCSTVDDAAFVVWTLAESPSTAISDHPLFRNAACHGVRPSRFRDMVATVRQHCASARHRAMLALLAQGGGVQAHPRLRELIPVPATTRGTFSQRVPFAGTAFRSPLETAPLLFETAPRHTVNINGYDFAVSDVRHGDEAFETARQRAARHGTREIAPRHAAASVAREMDERERMLLDDGDDDQDSIAHRGRAASRQRQRQRRRQRIGEADAVGGDGDLDVKHVRQPRLFLAEQMLSSGVERTCTLKETSRRFESTRGAAVKRNLHRARRIGEEEVAADIGNTHAAGDGGPLQDGDDAMMGNADRLAGTTGGMYCRPRRSDSRLVLVEATQRSIEFLRRYRRVLRNRKLFAARHRTATARSNGNFITPLRSRIWDHVHREVDTTVVSVEPTLLDAARTPATTGAAVAPAAKAQQLRLHDAPELRERQGLQVEIGGVYRAFVASSENPERPAAKKVAAKRATKKKA